MSIGQGEFGQVYAGKWQGTPVAIKTLKRGATTESKLSFYTEANILKYEQIILPAQI